jgi:hypothetical protein
MKKIILFLSVAFIIGVPCGFAQNNDVSRFTEEKAIAVVEEAISIIKANYLYMYFRYPEDTIANINKFIDNINEIVPVNKEKGDKIKELVLSKIKRTEKPMSVNHVLTSSRWYEWPDFILIMGINVDDILWACFDYSDYKNIYNKLNKNKMSTRDAYHYLSILYDKIKYPGEVVVNNWANMKGPLDTVFKYYGI